MKPNGLAFSPDESLLYVADTGASHMKDGPRHIRRLAVGDDNRLTRRRGFAECTAGMFDGFRIDAGVGSGPALPMACIATIRRTLIGKIRIPESVANVTFGGPKQNRLFITATTSLYAVYVTANGSKLG